VSVLFGGVTSNGQFFGDTWQWDGTEWTEIADSGPSARSGVGMVYDSNRSRVVLFGGVGANGVLGDTWEFDGQAWTQQKETGPTARSGVSMGYDSTNKVTVLFGGLGADGNTVGDTWTWDGSKWVQVAEFGASSRYLAAMSDGPGSLVLMGGLAGSGTTVEPLEDTWLWSGNKWTQLENIGPGPLADAAMVLDSARNIVVLFGGTLVTAANVTAAGSAPFSGNTWEGPQPAGTTVVSSVAVQSVVANPSAVKQGQSFTLTITLTGPAPAGGVSVSFGSTTDGKTITNPETLQVAAGQSSIPEQVTAPVGSGDIGFLAETPGTTPALCVVQVS